jgi:hypothetical protein
MSQDQLRPEGELRGQHANWARAHARLVNAMPRAAKPRQPRPVSPFIRDERPRWRRLFTRAIEEVDEFGNIVVHEAFALPWKRIAIDVARKHGVSFLDLISPRRSQTIVVARHECFWRCRNETTMSLPQIGKRFGGRDHTTVLHGVKKHEQRLRETVNG